MALITYDNKAFLNENSSVPDINKVKDTDMNEIKTVVNGNYNEVGNITGLNTTDKTSIVNAINELVEQNTYSTTEIVVGTYFGKPLYRKGFSGTLITSSGNIATELMSGVSDLARFGGQTVATDGVKYGLTSTNTSGSSGSNVQAQAFSRMIVLSNGTLRLDCSHSFSAGSYKVWAEYTKTTD